MFDVILMENLRHSDISDTTLSTIACQATKGKNGRRALLPTPFDNFTLQARKQGEWQAVVRGSGRPLAGPCRPLSNGVGEMAGKRLSHPA